MFCFKVYFHHKSQPAGLILPLLSARFQCRDHGWQCDKWYLVFSQNVLRHITCLFGIFPAFECNFVIFGYFVITSKHEICIFPHSRWPSLAKTEKVREKVLKRYNCKMSVACIPLFYTGYRFTCECKSFWWRSKQIYIILQWKNWSNASNSNQEMAD